MASASAYDLRFDSGRICLDLVATVGGRLSEAPVERLGGVEPLRAWLLGTGLVPGGTSLEAVDHRWLIRFRAARDLLHRIIHTEVEGHAAAADLERMNALAATGPPALRAVRTPDGTLVGAFAGKADCGALLSQIARDAVQLLTDPVARGQLRRCEGETCSLVYLDTSRGRRRRWCSSEVCGNRERVARHRRRVNPSISKA